MSKFKNGDIVKFYDKRTQGKYYHKIITVSNNLYHIYSFCSNQEFGIYTYNYEQETPSETAPQLINDEDKLELL